MLAPAPIILVHRRIHVAFLDIPPHILIVVSDPCRGLRILYRRVLIKVRVEPIKTLLVDMIENTATGALLLIGGGLLSSLCTSSGCRSFATSRVSVFARLSQGSLCFES